jgi:hypothetical protein
MKKKTPPDQGGASKFSMSLLDRQNSKPAHQEYQVKWLVSRHFFTAERARLISELAFGMEVRS